MDGQCFALLIDADNVSAKYIKPILTELSKYGNITYKRIYGDWTNTQHSSWKDELLKNSITPIQQFSYTQGKNSTDSAMIIKENRARKEDVDQFVRNLVKGAGEAGMDLGAIGNRVYDKYKDFKLNDYGYSQFKKYVKSISHMKLEQDGKRWKAHYKK